MTPSVDIRVGEAYALRGALLTVSAIRRNKLIFERPSGSEEELTTSAFIALYRKGELVRIEAKPGASSLDPEVLHRISAESIEGCSDKQRSQGLRRKRYLDQLRERGYQQLTVGSLLEADITKIATEIGDRNPPSCVSVVRWARRDRGAVGGQTIPRFDLRGGPGRRRFGAEVLQIVDDKIDQHFLKQPPERKSYVHEKCVEEIDRRNRLLPANKQLTVPSLTTVRRIIAALPRYDVICAQRGREAADHDQRWTSPKLRVTHILQRVEIDHTLADVMLVNEAGKPVQRPTITAVIDVYSRVILGVYVGFEPPSWDALRRAVMQATLPKPASIEGVGGEDPWPYFGRFDEACVDNGKDFLCEAFEAAALDLGFGIACCRRKRPWEKPFIERWFRTANTDFIHRLPGTTYSNPIERGAYKPEEHACLTLEEFRERFVRWIVEKYHHRLHKGLGMTPAQAWARSSEAHPPRLPPSVWEVKVAFGQVLTKKVQHKGITLHTNQDYDGEFLAGLRRQYGVGAALDIKYFSEDIGSIAVRDPESRKYFEVLNTDPGYAAGLSLSQHVLNIELDKRGAQHLSPVGRSAGTIDDEVDRLAASDKARDRKKAVAVQDSSTPTAASGAPGPKAATRKPGDKFTTAMNRVLESLFHCDKEEVEHE